MAVRTGAVRPDLGTVDSFRRALLSAKAVAVTSTPGIYLTKDLFPRLGVADKMHVVVTARGSQSIALLASGEVDLAILPVSELLHVTGIDFVGPIPKDVQFIQVFATAVTAGAKEAEAANRFIAFLASERATSAIRSSGMEALGRGAVH